MTRIKICGLTREEDVERCLELGVDFLGFNLWTGSPRFLEPERAKRLVERVGRRAIPVGVLVLGESHGPEVAEGVGVRWLQVHGPGAWNRPAKGRTVVRALAVTKAVGPADLVEGDYWLLDAAQKAHGGGGRRFDWSLAERLEGHPRLFIAGGLDPDNVAEVVKRMRPYAVDVASGCESTPGVKDPAKLATFVAAVREAGGA